MWAEHDYFSFDDGHRVEGFREFQKADTFERVALELADRAREEVYRLRERFSSIEATAAYLDTKKVRDVDLWDQFHAGISAGLAGWSEKARARLSTVIHVPVRDAGGVGSRVEAPVWNSVAGRGRHRKFPSSDL
jgi:hypothetical protein